MSVSDALFSFMSILLFTAINQWALPQFDWSLSWVTGAINTTAANIEVKTFKPSPPPTLRDFMNPDVGKCIYETSNMFQQEQLTGMYPNLFGAILWVCINRARFVLCYFSVTMSWDSQVERMPSQNKGQFDVCQSTWLILVQGLTRNLRSLRSLTDCCYATEGTKQNFL